MTERETCKTCRYWQLSEFAQSVRVGWSDEDRANNQECHKLSPGEQGWPFTESGDWCGEHKPIWPGISKEAVDDASQVLIEHLKMMQLDYSTPDDYTWCTQEYPVEGKLSDGGPFWRVHVSLEPDSLQTRDTDQ